MQITGYTAPDSGTGRPYQWPYHADADAERARYLERPTQRPCHFNVFDRAA
jgi:hypothetical protein